MIVWVVILIAIFAGIVWVVRAAGGTPTCCRVIPLGSMCWRSATRAAKSIATNICKKRDLA